MDEDKITYDILKVRAEYAKEETDGKINNMVKDLAQKGIKVIIRSRIKTYESAKEKTLRCKCTMEQLSDFLGYRIITMYEEDIPIVGNYIDHRFVVKKTKDYLNNPKPLEMGGYCGAIHKKSDIQCMCDETPVSVPTEFQVVSLLMNANWELDHATCYKCKDDNPNALEENREILEHLKAIETIYARRRKKAGKEECRIWPTSEPEQEVPSESE